MIKNLPGRLVFTEEDFGNSIWAFGDLVTWVEDAWSCKKIHICSIYQGGLSLGHRISKTYNLPHSIVKFQARDAQDTEVTPLHITFTEDEDINLVFVDDIVDSGVTMDVCMKWAKDIYPNLKSVHFFSAVSKVKHPDLSYYIYTASKKWVEFPWE
jgi:hypoxanthine phosphoribosyltransferase